MKLSIYATSISALILSTGVNAALISTDWQSAGDNLVTRDTTNSLEWLDMTETDNMSFNTVSAQLGAGGQFNGWRYATNYEVALLFGSFGLTTAAHLNIAGPVDTAIVNFTNMMGNIMHDANPSLYSYGARGLIGESSGGNQYMAGVYYVTSSGTNFYAGPYLGFGATLGSPTIARFDLGSFLVRDATVVPVPAALWLFGSGLIGLAGIARRKTQA